VKLTSIFWPEEYQYKQFDIVESTNRTAFELCSQEPVSQPIWIQADEQTAGVGRRSRKWVSGTGNLFATLIFPILPDRPLPPLSFITALAVFDSVRTFLSESQDQCVVQVKWPNDVLINRRKISGILLEAMNKKTKVDTVLIGVGINLNSAPALDDLSSPSSLPTCLREHVQKETMPFDVMTSLAFYFASWINEWHKNGTQSIMATWRERAFGLGERGIARLENKVIEGVFREVTDEGVLIIETSHGLERVQAGDVFILNKE
jgi:BirA family biotin operon repressor/biotin-[acetyl-CoA-carboxylase] ligase